MNYLAHIFLSGADRQIQVGNFIGDFVKGKNYQQYPEKIREGILLHRQIDTFTDSHPMHHETVNLLRPVFCKPFKMYYLLIFSGFFNNLPTAGRSAYTAAF